MRTLRRHRLDRPLHLAVLLCAASLAVACGEYGGSSGESTGGTAAAAASARRVVASP